MQKVSSKILFLSIFLILGSPAGYAGLCSDSSAGNQTSILGVNVLEKNQLALISGWLKESMSESEIQKKLSLFSQEDAGTPFFERIQKVFEIRAEYQQHKDLNRVPQKGSLLILANNALIGRDKLALAIELSKTRPDLILSRSNILKDSENYLKSGGGILSFPGEDAGTTASADALPSDLSWNTSFVEILKRNPEVLVQSLYATRLTQTLISVSSPSLQIRTANKNHQIFFNIGSAAPAIQILEKFNTEYGFTASSYLYAMTHALMGRYERVPDKRNLEPIAGAIDPELLAKEQEKMKLLAETPSVKVLIAKGDTIPNTLLELGRLREQIFRSVNEGSGKARDVDQYDSAYYHMIAVDPKSGRIIGAYRVGLVDEIMKHHGVKGLYTHTLFEYEALLRTRLQNGVELGRSFVDTSVGLLAAKAFDGLWKGIAKFLIAHPKYTHLLGPVSISNSYSSASKYLLIQFFNKHYPSRWNEHVNARMPVVINSPIKKELEHIAEKVRDLHELNRIISDIDGIGIPPSMISYAKMNARYLAVNSDSTFNSIDGLVVTDMEDGARNSNVRPEMKKHFKEDGFREFCRSHGIEPQ